MGFPGYLLIGLIFLGLVAAMLQTIAEDTKRAKNDAGGAHGPRQANSENEAARIQ